MKNYFYEQDGQSIGPVNPEDIVALFEQEKLGEDTLVWSEGMSTWKPFKNHFERDYIRIRGAEEIPVSPAEDMQGSSAVEEAHKIERIDNMEGEEKVLLSEEPVPAPLFVRIVAFILDNLFLVPINLIAVYFVMGSLPSPEVFADPVASEALMKEVFGIITPLFLLYQTVMVTKYRATFGKMLMKLEVVDTSGNQLNWINALWRAVGHVLTSMFFYIGFLSILFTKRKQAVHDFLARSMVVSKKKD